MGDDPDRRLEYRLVPVERPAVAQVLDDLIRLVRQGIATAPLQAPQVSDGPGFRKPDADEQRELAGVISAIQSRIDSASMDSQAAVVKRADVAAQPDGEAKLAEEARRAAELVVSAVQRALLRGVKVDMPRDDRPSVDGP